MTGSKEQEIFVKRLIKIITISFDPGFEGRFNYNLNVENLCNTFILDAFRMSAELSDPFDCLYRVNVVPVLFKFVLNVVVVQRTKVKNHHCIKDKLTEKFH